MKEIFATDEMLRDLWVPPAMVSAFSGDIMAACRRRQYILDYYKSPDADAEGYLCELCDGKAQGEWTRSSTRVGGPIRVSGPAGLSGWVVPQLCQDGWSRSSVRVGGPAALSGWGFCSSVGVGGPAGVGSPAVLSGWVGGPAGVGGSAALSG